MRSWSSLEESFPRDKKLFLFVSTVSWKKPNSVAAWTPAAIQYAVRSRKFFKRRFQLFNAAFTETRQVCLWQNAGEEETREPFSLSLPYDVLLSCVCETFHRKQKARKLANVIVTDKWGKRRCWQEGKNVSAQMIKNENVPNKIYSRDFSSLPPPSKSFSRNIFQKSCL